MRPHPIPENQVCSECGLDWSLHPESPRRRDCIELLKAQTASNWWLTLPGYQSSWTVQYCAHCRLSPCVCKTTNPYVYTSGTVLLSQN